MSEVKLTKVVERMDLKNLTPDIDLTEKVITVPDINRPALQLIGYFDHFDSERASPNADSVRLFLQYPLLPVVLILPESLWNYSPRQQPILIHDVPQIGLYLPLRFSFPICRKRPSHTFGLLCYNCDIFYLSSRNN